MEWLNMCTGWRQWLASQADLSLNSVPSTLLWHDPGQVVLPLWVYHFLFIEEAFKTCHLWPLWQLNSVMLVKNFDELLFVLESVTLSKQLIPIIFTITSWMNRKLQPAAFSPSYLSSSPLPCQCCPQEHHYLGMSPKLLPLWLSQLPCCC